MTPERKMRPISAVGTMLVGATVAAVVLVTREYSLGASLTMASLLFLFNLVTYTAAGKGIMVVAPSTSTGRRERRVALIISCFSMIVLVTFLIAYRP